MGLYKGQNIITGSYAAERRRHQIGQRIQEKKALKKKRKQNRSRKKERKTKKQGI
jgi:hypothetical protein